MRKRLFCVFSVLLILSLSVLPCFADSASELYKYFYNPFPLTLNVTQWVVEDSSGWNSFSMPINAFRKKPYTHINETLTYDEDTFTLRALNVDSYYNFADSPYNEATISFSSSSFNINNMMFDCSSGLISTYHRNQYQFSFDADDDVESSVTYYISYSYRDPFVDAESWHHFNLSGSVLNDVVLPFSTLSSTYGVLVVYDFRLTFSVGDAHADTIDGEDFIQAVVHTPIFDYDTYHSMILSFESLGGTDCGDYYTGYQEGLSEGTASGYLSGYDDGYAEGYNDGSSNASSSYQDGYNAGVNMGYSSGYNKGHEDGYSEGYYKGYDDGRFYGLQEGYNFGYDLGFETGYDQGLSMGSGDYDFTSWLANAVENFFSFHLTETITLGLILACVLSACIVIFIIKHTS